jgi:hypothetical protein
MLRDAKSRAHVEQELRREPSTRAENIGGPRDFQSGNPTWVLRGKPNQFQWVVFGEGGAMAVTMC